MFEQIIFKKKKFSDILEEIYKDTKVKEKQVSGLISTLQPLIKDTGDATMIVPLIKEYLEIGIKNSDNLIKMAAICQRMMSKQVEGNGEYSMSEEEKKALLDTINDIQNENKQLPEGPKVIEMTSK